MKKGSQQQFSTHRAGIERIIPTVSSLFLVQLKWSARLSVLKHCGITRKTLHGMGVMELKSLLSTLHEDTSSVVTELGRRGKKMSSTFIPKKPWTPENIAKQCEK